MTAAKLDPTLSAAVREAVVHELTVIAGRQKVATFKIHVDSIIRIAASIAARVLEKLPPSPASPPAAIGPTDTALIDRALGIWSSDYNDAPHADIARIRALLSSPGGGS